MTALLVILIAVPWFGTVLHVLFTPLYRFQVIGKSKWLWLFLGYIGCIPACYYYLISVRPKLKAAKNEQPPLKPLI